MHLICISSEHFWQSKMSKQYFKEKKWKTKVTAFKNTAVLVVKKARTALITDNMNKGSISYRKATEG